MIKREKERDGKKYKIERWQREKRKHLHLVESDVDSTVDEVTALTTVENESIQLFFRMSLSKNNCIFLQKKTEKQISVDQLSFEIYKKRKL
jgi:hypothetical protein